MQVLDGKAVAKSVQAQIKQDVQQLKQQGVVPGLAVILVGDDPASHVYVKNKVKACENTGMTSFEFRLPEEVEQTEVLKLITQLNEDPLVHGILVQLPLPQGLNKTVILDHILPEKDVDGLHYQNLGLLVSGRPRAIACTPHGVMKILEHYQVPVAGASAVVVGRSQIVGKPMAELLVQANATVTVCHSKTKDLRQYTSQADIVVLAAGQARMFGKDDFKKGAVVIDVGIHRIIGDSGKAKLCGDVRFEELDGHVAAATPVPGGVGPMTITMLLQNCLKLAQSR